MKKKLLKLMDSSGKNETFAVRTDNSGKAAQYKKKLKVAIEEVNQY